MKTATLLAVISSATLLLSAAACGKGADADNKSAAKENATGAKANAAKATAAKATAAADGTTAHAAAGDGAKKDATLKELMAQLGVDMGEIGNALWREDFAAISKHARAIANHPHATMAERKRIMKTLGADFGKFVGGDRHVHDTAVLLHEAATKSDMDATLKQLATLQQGCVTCHATFRKRLTTP